MTAYQRVSIGDGLARLIASGVMPANTRVWEGLADDGILRVLRTIEPHEDGWSRHLSISHSNLDRTPGRYPSWDEQKAACWEFVPGVRLYAIMPAQTETFVNVHDTTFHWWENP